MKKNKKFLYDYLNAFAPVGQETEGQDIWKKYVKTYVDEVYTDAYGTAVATKYCQINNHSALDVVIEAHCDEIAWIITNIESDGMIRVKRHGGSDNMIAPSKNCCNTYT